MRAAPEAPETGPASEAEGSPGSESEARAMQAFQRGTQHYNNAQYEDALRAFQEAASLYASADFQYNIGLCYEKLDKPEEAIRAFEVYLTANPEAADRANVEDRIERLKARQQELASQPPPDNGEATEPGTPGTDPTPAKPARPLIIAGAALAGVGAAVALGGGIAFGVLAGRNSRDLEDVQTGRNPDGLTFDEARDLEDEGRRNEALQIGLAAGGAVIAVTGIVVLSLGLRRKREASGRTALVPHFGRNTAGVSLAGKF